MTDNNFDISNLFPDSTPENGSNGTPPDIEDRESETTDTRVTDAKKNRRRIKGRYVFLAVIAVGIAIYTGYISQQSMSITQVTVEGTYFVKPEAVIRQVHLKKGINADSLNYLKIITSVEKLPYVKQAYLHIVPPHELVVRVEERQPAAMLVNGQNKIYVDLDGVKLPIIEGKSRNVPLVYGFRASGAGDTLKSDDFESVADFLKAANQYPLAKAMISEIVCTPDDGIVALTQPDGVKLIFGKKNFDRKFSYWKAFYRQVISGKGLSHFYSVDLRYRGQVVTRDEGT